MMTIEKTLLIALLTILPNFASADDANHESLTRTVTDVACRGESEDSLINRLCRLDLVYPSPGKQRADNGYATIVWLHGGGLAGGNRGIPKGLFQREIAIATVDYRLTPKVNSRVCIEDAAAVAWVFDHVEEYGGSKERIFLSGHSAGG